MSDLFPLGKLPPDFLAGLLSQYTAHDSRVILGPRPGEDAAVIDIGPAYLIAKTDPITFASDEIGWYAVNINANDIAATGGTPLWFMASILYPEGKADRAMVSRIVSQINAACDALGITVVGGHSEITYGINRPIVTGVMLGLAPKDRMLATGGAQPGDILIVTKGVPIEATALIARERPGLLTPCFSTEEIARLSRYLTDPGLSVVRDAAVALEAGRIHAMHDPTEGGLASGLWEMAEAASRTLLVDCTPALLPDGLAVCEAADIDPLGAIASGALLISAHPDDAASVIAALRAAEIAAFSIGRVEDGPPLVCDLSRGGVLLMRPPRDEIARLFE